MNLRFVVDINLSPSWVDALEAAGLSAVHWSAVGDPRASDREIMTWASQNGHVVFTHDLDFGTILALTHAVGPSVVQVRGQDVLPDAIGEVVVLAIRHHEVELEQGAIVVVDAGTYRSRVLPIRPRSTK